ncbi:hypothetical protein KC872_02260, partial [Candidatus Kaiserbacteria bacterium]|nr:hypothetical protein [Candidatus Kaiserbacteria bacterium]
VGTTIAFRVGPFDAEVLETVFTPRFLAADLVNLGFAQIYLTLMIDGIGSQPFSAQTLPPVKLPPVSCRGMVIEESRKLYAKNKADVEKLVAELHNPTPNQPSDNKKDNAPQRKQTAPPLVPTITAEELKKRNQSQSPQQIFQRTNPSVDTSSKSAPLVTATDVTRPPQENSSN